MARCRIEPDVVRAFAKKEFQPSTEAFLDALQRALPNLSRTELTWKFDLAIAVLLRVLNEVQKPGSLIQDDRPETIKYTVDKQIKFLAPALRS